LGFDPLNFAVSIEGKYCFGATSGVDAASRLAWAESCTEQGIEHDDYWPLAFEDGKMGVYKLIRSYRDRNYNAMGDYACGDSGKDGDFQLVRVDDVPEVDLDTHVPMECDHNSCYYFVPLRYRTIQIGGCGRSGGFCKNGPIISEYTQEEKKKDIAKYKRVPEVRA